MNRRPNGIEYISTGFHHYGNVRCSSNYEAKSVCQHTKVRATNLDDRVPQESRSRCKRRTPATGVLQIIDGCAVSTTEYIRSNAWSVTLEKEAFYTVAISKRAVPYASDTLGDRNAAQAKA